MKTQIRRPEYDTSDGSIHFLSLLFDGLSEQVLIMSSRTWWFYLMKLGSVLNFKVIYISNKGLLSACSGLRYLLSHIIGLFHVFFSVADITHTLGLVTFRYFKCMIEPVKSNWTIHNIFMLFRSHQRLPLPGRDDINLNRVYVVCSVWTGFLEQVLFCLFFYTHCCFSVNYGNYVHQFFIN